MLKEIRLSALTPSPTNPRKTFDAVKLKELSRSVAEKGVLEPILVRPTGKDAFEIVAGERRFRAATMAEVEKVPCIVRELSDVDALEVQTIENLQRDDLHPLEEGEGYAALMKEAGYDVAQIAQRISKSEKYVYDRLKLLNLVPRGRQAFLDGEITVGHAILLARLQPADQERVIGDQREGAYYVTGGLFKYDNSRAQPRLGLDDDVKRKSVSVRELAQWIEDHVRFDPETVDLPNLFPETEEALEMAEEAGIKVIHITREHAAANDAKVSGVRTYGNKSWKRADGNPEKRIWSDEADPSEPCEHSVMGLVVAGPGRGEAFRVCAAKKKCKVHWGEEQQEAKRQASQPDWKKRQEERDRKWKAEQEARDAERARWKKAAPTLLEALAEKVRETPAMDLADLVVKQCRPHGRRDAVNGDLMNAGESPEDVLRYAAFLIVAGSITNEWMAADEAPKALKPFGIDAKKIVNKVAPKPRKKPKKKATKKAKATKKKPAAKAAKKDREATKPDASVEDVRTAVAAALEENADASVEDLYNLGVETDAAVGKLSRRQFHARYVLPVKRKRKATA